jgi:rhodanese-related sulfurtransferase
MRIMAKEVKTDVTKITVNDVLGRLERDEPVFFVDSRNPQAWAQSDVRLPGAARVPADEVEKYLADIPTDRTIVTYCT